MAMDAERYVTGVPTDLLHPFATPNDLDRALLRGMLYGLIGAVLWLWLVSPLPVWP